jgi:hypothetical protein
MSKHTQDRAEISAHRPRCPFLRANPFRSSSGTARAKVVRGMDLVSEGTMSNIFRILESAFFALLDFLLDA